MIGNETAAEIQKEVKDIDQFTISLFQTLNINSITIIKAYLSLNYYLRNTLCIVCNLSIYFSIWFSIEIKISLIDTLRGQNVF